MKDPNPRVSGRGLAALRRAGIAVATGLLRHEAEELNRMFIRHIQVHHPYVHLKVARSLDGKLAPAKGGPRWISSGESRRVVHSWRTWHDAVLVGAGTVMADDPRLDVRLVKGRDPDVVILDGRLAVSPSARLFRNTASRRVFICTTRRWAGKKEKRLRELSLAGATVLVLPSRTDRIPLRLLLRVLYRQMIGSILLEGGREVFTEFLEEGLVDELSIFVAPMLLPGGISEFASGLRFPGARPGPRHGDIRAWMVGPDLLVNARFPIH